jgi:hypothetical protein
MLKNSDCRLLKKLQRGEARILVIVSVKLEREFPTNTSTTHEHGFKRGDRAQRRI